MAQRHRGLALAVERTQGPLALVAAVFGPQVGLGLTLPDLAAQRRGLGAAQRRSLGAAQPLGGDGLAQQQALAGRGAPQQIPGRMVALLVEQEVGLADQRVAVGRGLQRLLPGGVGRRHLAGALFQLGASRASAWPASRGSPSRQPAASSLRASAMATAGSALLRVRASGGRR